MAGVSISSQPVLLWAYWLLPVQAGRISPQRSSGAGGHLQQWPVGWQTHAGVTWQWRCVHLHWCLQQQQHSISAGPFLLQNQVLKCPCPLRAGQCESMLDLQKRRVSLHWNWFLQLHPKAEYWQIEVIALLTLFLLLHRYWGSQLRTPGQDFPRSPTITQVGFNSQECQLYLWVTH